MAMVARSDAGGRAGEQDRNESDGVPVDVLAGEEPSVAELAAIEEEWPVIAAEVAVVDAEAGVLAAGENVTDFHWRRLRHANRHLAAAWLWYATRRAALVEEVA